MSYYDGIEAHNGDSAIPKPADLTCVFFCSFLYSPKSIKNVITSSWMPEFSVRRVTNDYALILVKRAKEEEEKKGTQRTFLDVISCKRTPKNPRSINSKLRRFKVNVFASRLWFEDASATNLQVKHICCLALDALRIKHGKKRQKRWGRCKEERGGKKKKKNNN